MKRFFYVFAILLYTSAGLSDTDTKRIFEGTWKLNNADGYFGGILEIDNCTDIKCKFKVQSWHDLHTCDADGEIILTLPTTGVYNSEKYAYDRARDSEYYVPVGIKFELLPDGGLLLKYLNSDSADAFCGMSATVAGTWTNQKN